LGIGNQGNHVPMIVMPSPGAVASGMRGGPFVADDYYNHYSLQRTIAPDTAEHIQCYIDNFQINSENSHRCHHELVTFGRNPTSLTPTNPAVPVTTHTGTHCGSRW
jgi:uncharacterized protein YcnI